MNSSNCEAYVETYLSVHFITTDFHFEVTEINSPPNVRKPIDEESQTSSWMRNFLRRTLSCPAAEHLQGAPVLDPAVIVFLLLSRSNFG